MKAYINDLLDENLQLVSQFKTRIEDVLPQLKNDFQQSDLSLFRFLVARDLNLDRAEEMFRKNLEWRKVNKLDMIMTFKLPATLEEDSPMIFCGYDKRGCPVVYNPMSEWQGPKFVKMGWHADVFTRLRQYGERLMEIFEHAPNGNVCQCYAIFDMEGYDYSQLFNIEQCRLTQDAFQDYLENFPEIMCRIRIINAPRLFQVAWALLEPIFTGRTLSKVEISGTNKAKWKAAMLNEVDPDNLPSRCGGALTTPFIYKMEYGLNAFPRYENLPEEEFQEVLIPAGRKHSVEYDLNKGAKLSWNFKTHEFDVGFEVSCDKTIPVVRYCRLDSHKFVQKGLIVAASRGKYILTFDNTYSKLTPKKLSYVVKATKN